MLGSEHMSTGPDQKAVTWSSTDVQAPAPPAIGAPISLAYAAYERIRDRLIMLDIRPGEPINDVVLAADSLGVGRTPVREALKRLETDHLVVSYPRRGTFATSVDVTELGAISDLRQQLEPLAASRAAERRDRPDASRAAGDRRAVRGLESVARRPDQLDRLRTWPVHSSIYRATGNKHLEDVLIRYDNLATRIWCLVIDKLPDLAEHIREHSLLLETIAAGDGDQAASLALQHVASFERAIRRVL